MATRRVHVLVVHLGLLRAGRVRQLRQLSQFIAREIAPDAPLLVAGDFNDLPAWVAQQLASSGLAAPQALRCATFPSRLPLVQLDHVLARGLVPVSARVPRGMSWARMSDHLPLITEWTFAPL